jgi:hypothetical protein
MQNRRGGAPAGVIKDSLSRWNAWLHDVAEQKGPFVVRLMTPQTVQEVLS